MEKLLPEWLKNLLIVESVVFNIIVFAAVCVLLRMRYELNRYHKNPPLTADPEDYCEQCGGPCDYDAMINEQNHRE